MNLNLRFQFAFYTAIIIIAVSASIAFILTANQLRQIRATSTSKLQNDLLLIKTSLNNYGWESESLKELLPYFINDSDLSGIYILENTGKIIANKTETDLRESEQLIIQKAISQKFANFEAGGNLFHSQLVSLGPKKESFFIIVGTSLKSEQDFVSQIISQSIIWSTTLACIGIILSMAISRFFIGPIIEARKQAAKSLNYSRTIINTVGSPLIVLNKEKKIQSVNEAFRKFFECEDEDPVTKAFSELFPEWRSSTIIKLITDSLQKGTPIKEYFLNYKEEKILLVNGHPFEVEGETMLLLSIHDITRRQKLQDQLMSRSLELEQSNEELEKFAYIASHDLKSPLRAIDNLSVWISEDLEGKMDEDTENNIKRLRSRVKRMENLVEDLLDYSRVGKKSYKPEEVDVKEMIRDIVNSIELPSSFEIRIGENLPVFITEKVPLEVVFRNLISNAVKHHDKPDEGIIEITSFEHDDLYEFTIKDNGPGIPAELHKKVFEMFQTLQSRDNTEGSGLGLSIIEKIVRSQGCRLILDSEVGTGSAFSFTWPVNSKAESEKTGK